ncbi:hypothetical protein L204_101949 [Cryptococcus depauperatus]|nr:hypothetical protein L204_05600 [Cryptococcus depauperatus CBS 7855]
MPFLRLARAEPHLTDETNKGEKDFFQQHSTYFYSIFGGICALVLIICAYALWRGSQRGFCPSELLCCGRRKQTNDTTRTGGMQKPKQAGSWRKTVYLTDLRRATGAMQKSSPSGITKSEGETDTKRKESANGRMGKESWTRTVSSFGHPASILVSSSPQLQRQGGDAPAAPARGDNPESFYDPRARMNNQAWAPNPYPPSHSYPAPYGPQSQLSLTTPPQNSPVIHTPMPMHPPLPGAPLHISTAVMTNPPQRQSPRVQFFPQPLPARGSPVPSSLSAAPKKSVGCAL